MTKQNWFGVGYSLILAALVLSSIDIFHPQGLMWGSGLFIGLMLLVVMCLEVVSRLKTQSLRRQGLYPPAKQATLEDIEALLRANEKLRAIQLYKKMYRVSLQEALNSINRMEVR